MSETARAVIVAATVLLLVSSCLHYDYRLEVEEIRANARIEEAYLEERRWLAARDDSLALGLRDTTDFDRERYEMSRLTSRSRSDRRTARAVIPRSEA